MTHTVSISHLRAIMYGVMAYAMWATADGFIKLAGQEHISPFQVMAFYGIACCSVIFVFAACQGRLAALKPKRVRLELARTLTLTAMGLANVVAFTHLQLTQVYAVVFAAPMIMAIYAALFMREHLSWQKGLAIAVGFVGVIIGLDPSGIDTGGDARLGYIALPFCLILYVAGMLMTRVLAKTEHTESMAFFPQAGRFLLTLPICVLDFQPMTPAVWVYVLASGVFGSIGWLLISAAFKRAPTAVVAPTHYSQMIFGAILGYFVWHSAPTLNLALGATIIIASGLYLARQARSPIVDAELV